MSADEGSEVVTPDPLEDASPGECPFARRNRTANGKLALGLSLVPLAVYGLFFVFQPG